MDENIIKLADDLIYDKADGCCKIRIPKKVATIKLCGMIPWTGRDQPMNK